MPLEKLQDTDLSALAIASHQSSSYPEYLSLTWDEDTQRAVVWMRLQEHRKLANQSLAKINERYKALHQEQQTQAKPCHEPSSRDTRETHTAKAQPVDPGSLRSEALIRSRIPWAV